jgi:hypothetical protein
MVLGFQEAAGTANLFMGKMGMMKGVKRIFKLLDEFLKKADK